MNLLSTGRRRRREVKKSCNYGRRSHQSGETAERERKRKEELRVNERMKGLLMQPHLLPGIKKRGTCALPHHAVSESERPR